MENNQTVQPKSKTWIWIVVAIVVIGGAWASFSLVGPVPDQAAVSQAVDVEAVNLEPAPIAGHPAPDFTLQNLAGETVQLSDFKGQPVIINFWATWCGPCRIEMPHLEAAYNEHLDDGLVILAVNLTARDNVEDIPAFRDEFGLTFPIILDETGDVATTYKLIGQPASVFVDKNGVTHEVWSGPINEAFINERVAQLLSS